MNTKKLLTLATLLVLATAATHSRADDSWWQFFVHIFYNADPKQSQPQNQKQSHARHGISDQELRGLQKDLCEVIDRLFATNQQPKRERREIEEIKKQTVQRIFYTVGHQSQPNIKALRNAANAHLDQALAQTVAQHARKVYEQKAAYAPGRPAFNPVYLAEQTEQEIREHALKAIKFNEHGALAYYVGQELEKRMQKKVSHDYNSSSHHTPPVSHDDHIYEVYPHQNSLRYEATIQKISSGAVHRESACCVCMEEFGPTLNRVTLACGHSICAVCLYNWLHVQHKNSCPICRNTIRSDEFPKSYLQQYI